MRTGELRRRRSIRLAGYDYTDPGAYFVTIVADRWRLLLGEVIDGAMHLSGRGRIAEACWQAIPDHFPHVELGAFVIMPNHVHGILIINDRAAAMLPQPVGATHWVAPTQSRVVTGRIAFTRPRGPTRGSLGAIVGAYKMAVTRAVRQQLGDRRLWQRNYYEHVIRDSAEWNRIHLYIESNPVNWNTDEENPDSVGARLNTG